MGDGGKHSHRGFAESIQGFHLLPPRPVRQRINESTVLPALTGKDYRGLEIQEVEPPAVNSCGWTFAMSANLNGNG